jgi:hypothetical protein
MLIVIGSHKFYYSGYKNNQLDNVISLPLFQNDHIERQLLCYALVEFVFISIHYAVVLLNVIFFFF